ncbi:MAG TPA: elongation factor G, partial [Microthrixaceae bacterium]|nr:elongation factor G [Microthrixaceae bacterium]
NVPRMCFVNKMDRMGADFYGALASIQDRLEAKTAVIQLPIGAEADYKGIVDLVTMKAWIWAGEDLGASWDVVDIPADMQDKADEYREMLIDVLSETNDEIMEKFLEGDELSPELIRAALRDATINHGVIPVLNGTAFKNKGVQPLLDAVCFYMPSPLDLPPVTGENRKGEEITRKPDVNEPFSALAFKIMTAPHVGKLTYFRVYSGKLEKGGTVYNSRSGDKERIGRLLEMHANDQIEQEAVFAGDIVAGIGIKNTRTGDTLSDPSDPIVLESLEFPDPVIHVAVEPKTKADQDKMGKALFALSEEDPTFQVRTDEETAQTIISGMGELHLEVLVDRMMREFKVEANVGKPQVAYRETITQPVEGYTYLHKKQTGGTGQYAKIVLTLTPSGPGGGFEFTDKITGGRVPKEYIPSVGHGVADAMTNGILAGFPMVDIHVSLDDGDYHDVDSSEMAFKIAGTMGFKEAARKAAPVLLEPIMAVEVVTPEDYMGDVIGDLNSRRGKVGKMEQRGNNQIVSAEVPLSDMFGYSTDLRSKTQGRAQYTMQFHSYQQTPRNVQEEIVARITGQ